MDRDTNLIFQKAMTELHREQMKMRKSISDQIKNIFAELKFEPATVKKVEKLERFNLHWNRFIESFKKIGQPKTISEQRTKIIFLDFGSGVDKLSIRKLSRKYEVSFSVMQKICKSYKFSKLK